MPASDTAKCTLFLICMQEQINDAVLSGFLHSQAGRIQVMLQDKTRQDKTRQDKTRQDKTRPDKTRQDKTRPDKTRQDKPRQDKARQDKEGKTSLASDQ